MQLTRKMFHRRWAHTAIAAVLVFAVLAFLDKHLKAMTGFGTIDLQKVSTAAGMQAVLAGWTTRRDVLLAGFDLGFDYLFMPLYALTFFYGAIAAREAFAATPGRLRRAMTLLAAVPLAGALLDATENGTELYLAMTAQTDRLVALAFAVTTAKWICIAIGILLTALGIIGLFQGGKKDGETAKELA